MSSTDIDFLVQAGLQDRVVLPTAPDYATRIDSYFNNCAKLKPSCILMPQNTIEVACAVKALVKANQKFAVRSGGSNFWPSNNIEGGVTVDLGRINTIAYDGETETARLGAGAISGQVRLSMCQLRTLTSSYIRRRLNFRCAS